MSIELATHPDDLNIVCGETKNYPGKYVTDFYRGEGHNYKPLLTCDTEESLAIGKEAAINRIRVILQTASFAALYHGSAPENCEEFIKCIREAGYDETRISNEEIAKHYAILAEKGVNPMLTAIIDVKRVLNAAMIDEIMARLVSKGYCDTSETPLVSFTGSPTS